MTDLRFIWIELTSKCQLSCLHCYAGAGPDGTHGTMTVADWRRVIDEAAVLGVEIVQFIGGEPTLHPDLPGLLGHALDAGLEVEVFSNLVHVSPALWELLSQPGVRLACSYYSDNPAQHAKITGRAGSHARTRGNIAEAVRRQIPLRVGVIDMDDEQRVEHALAELGDLGVTDVGTDRLRQVGRGVRNERPSVEQLCGNCSAGVAAISSDGEVWPCVFARWMPSGNVRRQSLVDILATGLGSNRAVLDEAFAAVDSRCGPSCNPINCRPRCQPMAPDCQPKECVPARKYCSPNYPGPNRRCRPHTSPDCNPSTCRPSS